VLYASPTSAGGFTSTAPQAPNNIVTVAIVITSSTSNGAIFVRPTFSSNINEDEGVKITSPVANEGLFYNGGYWENKTIASALGYTPANAATTLTINGQSYDLSADRTWTVGTIGGTGASGQVAFWNGTNTQTGDNGLFWDNTNKRLGINTTTPARTLDIFQASATVSLTPTANTQTVGFITNAIDNSVRGGFTTNIATGEIRIGALGGAGYFPTLYANGVEGFRMFATTRNVLLQNGGTFTDAGFRLDVNGTARVQGNTTISNGSSGASVVSLADDLWVQSSGDTGITISSPNASGSRIYFGSPADSSGAFIEYLYNSGLPKFTIGTTTSDGFLSLVSGANIEKQRIFANGNVLIQNGGTFTDSGFRLDVNGTARVQGVLTTTADAVVNGVNIGIGGGAITTNTRVGVSALANNTTGSDNTANGASALFSNTTGSNNTANGYFALRQNTTGGSNTANGSSALRSNTTGSGNTAVGGNAGRSISDGVTANTITNNSVFLGANTRALADNQTNQIVIGHTAIGLGSNTTVLGNTSTTHGRWYGSLLLGTITNAASSILTMESTTQGFLPPRMTAAQRTAIASPATGLIVYQTDGVEGLYVRTSTAWRALGLI